MEEKDKSPKEQEVTEKELKQQLQELEEIITGLPEQEEEILEETIEIKKSKKSDYI